nr:MAG TPA: hypothetical protein [Caudoviricetes sp.]
MKGECILLSLHHIYSPVFSIFMNTLRLLFASACFVRSLRISLSSLSSLCILRISSVSDTTRLSNTMSILVYFEVSIY